MTAQYHIQLEKILAEQPKPPKRRLLLHACCGPCASYVLEYLAPHFDICVYFYNPNIAPAEEYDRRLAELKRFMAEFPPAQGMELIEAPGGADDFAETGRQRAQLPERGAACFACYALRLEKTAQAAAQGGYDFFCTTLSISPHKDAQEINRIGQACAQKYAIPFLPGDFKKRGGFARSLELGSQYGLYRQSYCGCAVSRGEADRRT